MPKSKFYIKCLSHHINHHNSIYFIHYDCGLPLRIRNFFYITVIQKGWSCPAIWITVKCCCPLIKSVKFNLDNSKYTGYIIWHLKDWSALLYQKTEKAQFKGQIISKQFLVSSDSSKKRTNKFVFLGWRTKNEFVRSFFWKNPRIPKSPFEIIWPLGPLIRNLLRSDITTTWGKTFWYRM